MNEPLKVLYVDDEPDIRTIVELSLRLDPAIELVVAGSGDEALEKVGAEIWMPDIALIDMMMPGMTGLELLQQLRARADTAAIPVIFVTASARSTEVDRYVNAGAIGVISKPFDAVSLARLVRRHFEERFHASGD